MAKGQIACRISNSDFENFDSLTGVVIQEGTTAIIYIDGREVAQINAGIYNFVDNSVLDAALDKRIVDSRSLRGAAISAWKGLVKLVMGRKVGEEAAKEAAKDNKYYGTVQNIIRSFNAKSIISVYLKADTNFPLIFDMDSQNGEFVPMRIKTIHLDAEFVAPLFMRINDFKAFIREFMHGNQSVVIADVYNNISPYVKSLLQRELRNEEINDFGISDEAQERIASRLMGLNTFFSGVEIVQVLDISCDNAEFDRFRALSKELYCSEKELEYLRKTNEFKNRLAGETNSQTLIETKDSVALNKALDEINRDGLLNESEMQRFKAQLEADNEKASLDIDRYRLDNQYAFNRRQMEIEDELYEIGLKRKKRELHDTLEMDDLVRRHGYGKDVEDAEAKNRVLEESLKGRSLVDDYEDERKKKDFSLLEEKQKTALDALQRMQEMEEMKNDREHNRKLDFAAIEQQTHLAELRLDENLSDEKYFVKYGKPEGEAATVFAASFSAKHNAEQYQQQLEEAKERERLQAEEALRREKMSDERNFAYAQMVKEMAEKGMETTAAVASQRLDEVRALKDEYKDNLRHEQERHDRHQDTALNYTTRVQPSVNERKICPHCGKEVSATAKYCEYCSGKLS